MTVSFGWSGQILYINLSDRSSYTAPTEKYISFIGGRGINQLLLFRNISANVQALDPDNIIVLGSKNLKAIVVRGKGRLYLWPDRVNSWID